MQVTRDQALAFRVQVQELDRAGPRALTDAAVLDLGVQDTGDGAAWALANRGVEVTRDEVGSRRFSEDLVLVWSLRGAPHLYRRSDVAGVAAATRPYSDADAAKRIFDAAKPLREAGISPTEALSVVAGLMQEIVTEPTVKGDVSGRLTGRLEQPYLRWCRPCATTHVYEQPFRLSALQAGLELEPGTSPPVLRRIDGCSGATSAVPERLDVVRACLHLLGPTTPAHVAGYVDAPVREIKARWPEDAVALELDGERRWALADDLPTLEAAEPDPSLVRLLGPHDLFLQVRDRELVVPAAERRRQLWVVLGRPGAILQGSDVVGTWRPRASGASLRLLVDRWADVPDGAITEQAERLAAHRGLAFAGRLD